MHSNNLQKILLNQVFKANLDCRIVQSYTADLEVIVSNVRGELLSREISFLLLKNCYCKSKYLLIDLEFKTWIGFDVTSFR